MRIRDSKLIRGLRKPSVPREGEISPFWRVISFQRSMRINHGLEPFDNSVGGRRGKGRFTLMEMDDTGETFYPTRGGGGGGRSGL